MIFDIPQYKFPNKSHFLREKNASETSTHMPHRAQNLKRLS